MLSTLVEMVGERSCLLGLGCGMVMVMSVISSLVRSRDFGFYRAERLVADACAAREVGLLRVRSRGGSAIRMLRAERRVERRFERKMFRAQRAYQRAEIAAETLADWDDERWG